MYDVPLLHIGAPLWQPTNKRLALSLCNFFCCCTYSLFFRFSCTKHAPHKHALVLTSTSAALNTSSSAESLDSPLSSWSSACTYYHLAPALAIGCTGARLMFNKEVRMHHAVFPVHLCQQSVSLTEASAVCDLLLTHDNSQFTTHCSLAPTAAVTLLPNSESSVVIVAVKSAPASSSSCITCKTPLHHCANRSSAKLKAKQII